MKDQRVTSFEEGLLRSVRRLARPGSRWLVGVSGGADSRALLSGFAAIARSAAATIEACTVDHGFRTESAAEALQVGRWCAEVGTPHHVRQVVIAATTGLEAEARQARYSALEAVRTERGLDLIATAHTANDQAETVLMRLMRGASPTGLRGIHERRDDLVVRPLLFATRSDVLGYLEARGLAFVNDPMNADPRFLRVRVRTELLPKVVELGGEASIGALSRAASLWGEDERWFQRQVDEIRAAGPLTDEVLVGLPSPLGRRVLASWLAENGVEVDFELLADVLQALRDGRRATLPGDRLLTSQNGRVEVVAAPARLHATSSSSDGRKAP